MSSTQTRSVAPIISVTTSLVGPGPRRGPTGAPGWRPTASVPRRPVAPRYAAGPAGTRRAMQRLEHLQHLDKHLVDELAQVARETVRDELREQTRKQRRKAALYAASGATALYAGAALALAVVVLPDWAAAFITAVILAAAAYALRGAARPAPAPPTAPGTPARPDVPGQAGPAGGHGAPVPPTAPPPGPDVPGRVPPVPPAPPTAGAAPPHPGGPGPGDHGHRS